MLSVVALAVLRETFIYAAQGEDQPKVHIVQCCGEADPYLEYDGKFAVLIISDDSDFMVVPGVSVSSNKGITFTNEGGAILETRDLELIAQELGLNGFGRSKIAELASFIGNDYSSHLLEEPCVLNESISQEWLLEKSDALSKVETGDRKTSRILDRLIPLICNSHILPKVLEVISQHHSKQSNSLECQWKTRKLSYCRLFRSMWTITVLKICLYLSSCLEKEF